MTTRNLEGSVLQIWMWFSHEESRAKNSISCFLSVWYLKQHCKANVNVLCMFLQIAQGLLGCENTQVFWCSLTSGGWSVHSPNPPQATCHGYSPCPGIPTVTQNVWDQWGAAREQHHLDCCWLARMTLLVERFSAWTGVMIGPQMLPDMLTWTHSGSCIYMICHSTFIEQNGSHWHECSVHC